jgi:hypothetical protein
MTMSHKTSARKSSARLAACRISDAGAAMKGNFAAQAIAEVATFPTAQGIGL